jgi:hypothetical protein
MVFLSCFLSAQIRELKIPQITTIRAMINDNYFFPVTGIIIVVDHRQVALNPDHNKHKGQEKAA